MSVVKVTTPMSFNSLGHPYKGGLYDPALGKYRSDPLFIVLVFNNFLVSHVLYY